MQINETRVRKQGPKKVCGIERERSQNGAQIGTRNRQNLEKCQKKIIPKAIRKKGAERNRQISIRESSVGRLGSNFGAGGGIKGGLIF